MATCQRPRLVTGGGGTACLIGQLSNSSMAPAACPTHMPAGCAEVRPSSATVEVGSYRTIPPSQGQAEPEPNLTKLRLRIFGSSRPVFQTGQTTGEAKCPGEQGLSQRPLRLS